MQKSRQDEQKDGELCTHDCMAVVLDGRNFYLLIIDLIIMTRYILLAISYTLIYYTTCGCLIYARPF
jgi:hypothetical protein